MSERFGALHGRRALGRGSEDERREAINYEGSDSPPDFLDGSMADYDGVPFEHPGCMPAADGVSSGPSHCHEPDDDVGLQDSGASELGRRKLDAKGLRCKPGSVLMTQVPVCCWSLQLVRQALASKTKLPYFVMRLFSACRSGHPDFTATALYPIPFPFKDGFGDGLDLSYKRRRGLGALHRLVHLTIVAMNYKNPMLFMSILQLIQRRPTVARRGVFGRLWMFFKASGLPAFVSVAGCGRKGFQLDARMRESVLTLEDHGLSPPSLPHHKVACQEAPEEDGAYEELQLYRPPDVARTKLNDMGKWKSTIYPFGLPYLSFVEPESICFDAAPPSSFPATALEGYVEQVPELCRMWAGHGIWQMAPTPWVLEDNRSFLHSRGLGYLENAEDDSQVGDWRDRNDDEERLLRGPSRDITRNAAVLQLELPCFELVLLGVIADRREVYLQTATTYKHSATSTVSPVFGPGGPDNTKTIRNSQVGAGTMHKKDREEHEDDLGVPTPFSAFCDGDLPDYVAVVVIYQEDQVIFGMTGRVPEIMAEEAGCSPSWSRLGSLHFILHSHPAAAVLLGNSSCLSSESIEITNALFCKSLRPEVSSTGEVAGKGTVPLSRRAMEEFLTLARPGPLGASYDAASPTVSIFAWDAFVLRGVFVKAKVSESPSRTLWRTFNEDGRNPCLRSPIRAVRRVHDKSYKKLGGGEFWATVLSEVSRSIGSYFGSKKVSGGAGVMTLALCGLGVGCGPVFDIGFPMGLYVCYQRGFAWLIFSCHKERVRSFFDAPPCTTFGTAAYPWLGTYTQPLDFDLRHPRVVCGNGNVLPFLGWLVAGKGVWFPGKMKTPRRSTLRRMPQWESLCLLGANDMHLDSFAYGPIHQNDFVRISAVMYVKGIEKHCLTDHRHVRIKGKSTTTSDAFRHGPTVVWAKVFVALSPAVEGAHEANQGPGGAEDARSEEFLLLSFWKVIAGWERTGSAYIGLLEIRWVISLLKWKKWIPVWTMLGLQLCTPCSESLTGLHFARCYGPLTALPLPASNEFASALGFSGEGWFNPLFDLIFEPSRLGVAGAIGASHGDALRCERQPEIELDEDEEMTHPIISPRASLGATLHCWLRERGWKYDAPSQANPLERESELSFGQVWARSFLE